MMPIQHFVEHASRILLAAGSLKLMWDMVRLFRDSSILVVLKAAREIFQASDTCCALTDRDEL